MADIVSISRLITNVVLHNFSDVYPKKVIQNFCKNNSVDNIAKKMRKNKYYVAEHKNKIVAVASLKGNEIKSFHVDVDYQGCGIGKRFMRFLEKHFNRKLFKKIIVHSSIPAVKFYQKCGFVKVKDEIHNIAKVGRYKTVLMEKKIFV